MVPVDQDAGATMTHAVAGGEDYEICLLAGAGAMEHVQKQFEREFQLALTRIGFVQPGEGVHERLPDGTVRPATLRGYQHFKEQA
jgi:thiamine monophosphate kinase